MPVHALDLAQLIYYNFSLPIQKRNEPYNLYAISGKNWYNFSIDYSYTYKNLHFFGEAAADKNFNKAFVNGLFSFGLVPEEVKATRFPAVETLRLVRDTGA